MVEDKRCMMLRFSEVKRYLLLRTNIWTWRRYPQNACRNCSKLTKNEIVRRVSRTICNWFSVIPMTFVVASSVLTENRHSATRLGPEHNPNPGLSMENPIKKKRKPLFTGVLRLSKNKLHRLFGTGWKYLRCTSCIVIEIWIANKRYTNFSSKCPYPSRKPIITLLCS